MKTGMQINSFMEKYISILFLIALFIILAVSFVRGNGAFWENGNLFAVTYSDSNEGRTQGNEIIVRADGGPVAGYHVISEAKNIKVNKDDKEAELEDSGKTGDYWRNIGVNYFQIGKYREAIEALKQAIEIKPDDGDAYYYLGLAYAGLGKDKEAIEALKQAIQIKPDDADAYFYLGLGYGSLEMFRESIEALKQAIRIRPNDAGAYYFIGRAYDKLDMYREAIEPLKQSIRINPNFPEAYLFLGLAYDGLEMFRESIEVLKEVIRIKPDFAAAHLSLGFVFLKMKDKDSALKEYEILKELNFELANDLYNSIYK